jgi:hypothetical protein
MALIRRPSRLTPTVGAALALMLCVGWTPAPVAGASSVSMGAPSGDVTFGEGIEFSQPLVTTQAIERAELLLDFPGAIGPLVIDVSSDRRTGALQLRYTLEGGDGQLTPNTRIGARFRVAVADGTEFEGRSIDVLYADDRFDWRTRRDGLVRVHWYQGGDAFADRALDIAVRGLAAAEDFLGVSEAEPIDFFVYASEDDIYEALAPDRENIGGQAYPDIRTLFALITPAEVDDPWVGVVIPHEITHLVFDTAVKNDYGYPPKWLDEGLAVYLSEGYTSSDRAAVERAARDGTLIPLAGLVGQFPTTLDRFGLAYAESVSAIDYLTKVHGESALKELIAAYARAASDDEAFMAAVGIRPAEFDAAWRADLGAVEPVAYGPRPGEPGPVPADWLDTAAPDGSATPETPVEPAPSLSQGGLPLVLASLVFAMAAIGGLVIHLRRRPGGTVA